MHEGHRERLRKRFIDVGLDGFADHEVLELLLCYAIARRDVNPIAHRLLDMYGTLEGVFSADIKDLMTIDGIGEHSAVLISFVFSAMKRTRLQVAGVRPLIDTPQKASAYCSDLLRGLKHEAFYILMLDNNQKLIKAHLMSEGTNKETAVYPRKVVEIALRHGAEYVLLTHNHPGESIKPSPADIALTKKVSDALASVSIKCSEHIIVSSNAVYHINSRKTYFDESIKASQSVGVTDPYKVAELLRTYSAGDLKIVIDYLHNEDE